MVKSRNYLVDNFNNKMIQITNKKNNNQNLFQYNLINNNNPIKSLK